MAANKPITPPHPLEITRVLFLGHFLSLWMECVMSSLALTSPEVNRLPQLAYGGAGAPNSCSSPSSGCTRDAWGCGNLGRDVFRMAGGQRSADPASLSLGNPSAAHGCQLSGPLSCSSFSHLLPQPLPADSSGTASWHRISCQDVSVGGGDRCTALEDGSNPVGAATT